jgi:DNA mismatch repair protein MutS
VRIISGPFYTDGGVFGFAYADLSTGEFRLTQLQDRQSLLDELARVGPPELLVSDEQKEQFAEIAGTLSYDSYAFLPEQAVFTLCEHFKVKSLDGFGLWADAAGSRRCGRDCSLFETPASAQNRSSHLAALRCDR